MNRRKGFTLVELFVIIAIIVVLVALLLPNMRTTSDAARRMSCSNNLKQMGLAFHNHHSAHKQLPIAMGGAPNNEYRLSGLVSLLPFMQQQAIWQQVVQARESDGVPSPWSTTFALWQTEIPTLRCPSDPGLGEKYGRTNYAFSIGGLAHDIHQPQAQFGMFAPRRQIRFRNVLDGLSNTIAMAEINTGLGDRDKRTQPAVVPSDRFMNNPLACEDGVDSERPLFWPSDAAVSDHERGVRWADGAGVFSLVNTIRPPNSAVCLAENKPTADGLLVASSRHMGGCHVLMGDGAVIFMTDSIECGDQKSPVPTLEQFENEGYSNPYGLWGALGSIGGKEDIEENLNQ